MVEDKLISVTRTGNSWIDIIGCPASDSPSSATDQQTWSVQTREEVVGNAGRHLGFPVTWIRTPQFDQAALAAIDTSSSPPPVKGVPEHQRRHRSMSPNSIGRIKVHWSLPDDPQPGGSPQAHLAQLVLTDVLDVPDNRVQPQPAHAVDVADARKQPFSVEHVRR